MIKSRSPITSHQPNLLANTPFVARAFLVGCCVCFSGREPSKATTNFIFDFLFPSNLTPGSKRQDPPTRSALVASPLQRPPQRRCQLLFDCCVPSSNGGHLRPRVRPSLYFFIAPFAAPNDGQPSSPHVPPQPRLLSITLPNIEADFWLVVVFPHQLAAT